MVQVTETQRHRSRDLAMACYTSTRLRMSGMYRVSGVYMVSYMSQHTWHSDTWSRISSATFPSPYERSSCYPQDWSHCPTPHVPPVMTSPMPPSRNWSLCNSISLPQTNEAESPRTLQPHITLGHHMAHPTHEHPPVHPHARTQLWVLQLLQTLLKCSGTAKSK